ncbi:chromatin modification-related protein EAF1 B-like isoform X2 [Mangifera indica]|uniref:chromatin modification-related protein EAF1 B-like isoform X2 n=1 Tax=Mangifera indica TaxID=29780 RepID=UPI001CF93DEC|nr:chromatin modification-related protein EAF1 B-like isoform X2 [Mangifera indica]
MHGCGSGAAILVNAEVDSMGGVVDGGVGIGVKTSPCRAAIAKAQAELRQEYDVREERRRELEFLEKGGNPLDFKFGNAVSVSVQSTSLTDQLAEHFVTSEAKGSFALTASPHGDSVESSGRPGVPTICEPNSADNLLLFDGENELLEGERHSLHPAKKNSVVPSEQSFQMDGTQNAKESEDSAIFRPYARRNRSKINRDSARSSSNDIVQARAGHGSSLTVRGVSRDGKGSISDSNNQKERHIILTSDPKSVTSNGDVVPKIVTFDNQLNMELDSTQSPAVSTNPKVSLPEDNFDGTVPKSLINDQLNHSTQVDAQQTPNEVAAGEPNLVGGKEEIVSTGVECQHSAATGDAENESCVVWRNGFGDQDRDRKLISNDGQNNTAVIGTRLDSESSGTQNSLNLDVNIDSDACINPKDFDSNGILMEKIPQLEETRNSAGCEIMDKNENKIAKNSSVMSANQNSVYKDQSGSSSIVKVEEETNESGSDLNYEVKFTSKIEGVQKNDNTKTNTDQTLGNVLNTDSNIDRANLCTNRSQGPMDISICEPPKNFTERNSADAPDVQTESGNSRKLADKAHEDSILEEARIIEAKRKRIAELSVGSWTSESRRKSHWDFVLEEMAWLANDFAQERLWKMTAAAQICCRVAFTSRLRSEEQNQRWKLKKVALTIAKAVMQFWHSAEVLLNSDDPSVQKKSWHGSTKVDENKFSEDKIGELDMEGRKDLDQQSPRKNITGAIQGYAVRFLKHHSSSVPSLQAEAPATPDRISDLGIMEVSWDDHLAEESLFYAVSSGAMETYRKSIESHLAQCEKTGSSMQEEVDTSMYDAMAELGYHNVGYDEEEGETSAYYLPGTFEGSKSSKFSQKKRKSMPYGHGIVGFQQSMSIGKRPASNLNVGPIPTKRMRTASRQRIISPFSAGAGGSLQVPTKTDASSGDTSSYQDDQSTLHGGAQIQKSVEVESTGDFDRQLPYDCAETSTKPKKKKKAKHLLQGSAYEPGWQLDSTACNEQRDHSRKRLESHHFDSSGNIGLYGQHNARRLKIMKQPLDTTFDNITPMSGSIPSPAASQMSNMSNPTKFIKPISGRDRGRKTKALKPFLQISAGQPGSGSPWSSFEDQALVVLVHDMGPNWELVSDAINSTLQFKCIFRKPKECKERHKILMDRGAGDGADSAEDSGSSQSYPSTLPGIPKGSARQLFQRLQGPMEEDTVKSHFEKIIMIGKKQHYRKSQNDNQDLRQIVAVHNSHVLALSQVCPNNLSGAVPTPLELCDVTASSTDLPLGFQGSHASGLAISNQGAVASMLSASGANSSLQGSSRIVLSSNLSSSSRPLNPSIRDSRYNVPRTSLPLDEQQRLQHYNQMLSGRNMQQPNLSTVSGALPGAECGVRMLSGGNGMGVMCGMNRSMPITRPGFQGMGSSSMLNSGSMLSSSMAGMPSPVNMHSGAGSGQGNPMLRPREAMHMMRPGHNPDHQRQLIVPELQMQATQGNGQGLPAFNGLSSFSNQTTPPAVQLYPGHPQQQHQASAPPSHGLSNHHPHLQGTNHATGSQQQAYAIQLAKERHLQQRFLQQQQQQQQQQSAASGALMPHVQPQNQLPISSSLQSNSQVQPQTSSQPVTIPTLTASSPMTPISLQHQQKQHLPLPSHGLSRNPQSGASGLNNQMSKQRQRQPPQQQFQQPGRHHPQQRLHAQSQQQAKLLKGIGRGNMVMHQNLTVDPSHLNGLTGTPGNQATDKGEQIMHLMQGQGSYSGSSLSPVQPSKPLVPSQGSNHSQPQQKLYSSKQLQQMPSHSDNSPQGQVQSTTSGHTLSATHQNVLPAIMASNHQHLQLQPQPQAQQKQVNQTQTHATAQRMLKQNHQLNSDPLSKSQIDQFQPDQQTVNNASIMGTSTTTTMPQVCMDSANVVPISSSAVASQWKTSEPVYDSGMPNMANQVGSIGSSSLSNSAGSDAVSSISQGLGQRQLSGGLPPHGHNAATQWQHHSQLQQSPTLPTTSQQYCQAHDQQVLQQDQLQLPQQQLPPQQSQQQTQHLQAVQGSMYIRPTKE